MVQEGGGDEAELVLLLHPVREAQFFAALGRMKALSVTSRANPASSGSRREV